MLEKPEDTPTDKRRNAALRGYNACTKCGGMYTTTEMDGSKCDGLPGITYKVCGNCGRATAKTPRKGKNRL